MLPYHLYAGAAPRTHLENWATKLDVVAPATVPAFGGEAAYSAFRDSFLRLLEDPDTFTYRVLVIVEGMRPAAGGGAAAGASRACGERTRRTMRRLQAPRLFPASVG